MNSRLDHLREICKEAQVDGFLISSTSNIFYISGFNRFLVDHDGFLLVTNKSTYLITSPLYTEAARKFTPDLAVLETSPDVWYAQMVKKIVTQENLKVIGFEEKDLRVAEYYDLQDEKVQLKSVSLRNLRLQKDADEIAAIQKACELTDVVFKKTIPFLKEGVSELEISAKMTAIAQDIGADIGFPSIVAFGRHSAVPHHMTSDEKLTKNSFVLLDFGLKYNNYLSDMSRTVFFGSPTDNQRTLYETVKKSQQAAAGYIQNHMSEDILVKDVDKIARDVLEEKHFPVYPHALGHGVALEVHEAPTLSLYSPEKLLENTVFTLEPGTYDPTMGGVRIEDVYVLHNKKLQQLTNSSKDLIVI